jgi:hypothetical protein
MQAELLTAIVTHKNGDLEPGSGFYDMATPAPILMMVMKMAAP